MSPWLKARAPPPEASPYKSRIPDPQGSPRSPQLALANCHASWPCVQAATPAAAPLVGLELGQAQGSPDSQRLRRLAPPPTPLPLPLERFPRVISSSPQPPLDTSQPHIRDREEQHQRLQRKLACPSCSLAEQLWALHSDPAAGSGCSSACCSLRVEVAAPPPACPRASCPTLLSAAAPGP
eukprot:CAMPEP_0184321464 /NCGR_PEP_ID=MMETSP1049-20130417/119201_1 /TAXON_ID=77928 /ORGANISM="Proteomonas sulcata, Strain CCMP704" /LENGTH=180 /DNA_ID=CAMNT_0026642275 /DNA_START=263 /DNA_END=806 /DNA_ORIENTATION=+